MVNKKRLKKDMERRKNTLKKITKKRTTKKRITKKRNIKKINTLKKITKKRTTKKGITKKRNIKKRNTKRRLIGGMQAATEAGGSYSTLAEYDPIVQGEILMKGNLQKYTYTDGWEEREFMVTPNGLYWKSPNKGSRSVDGKYFNSIKKGIGYWGNKETDFTLSTSYRGGKKYKFRSNASEIDGWLGAFQHVIDSNKGAVTAVGVEDVAPELFSQFQQARDTVVKRREADRAELKAKIDAWLATIPIGMGGAEGATSRRVYDSKPIVEFALSKGLEQESVENIYRLYVEWQMEGIHMVRDTQTAPAPAGDESSGMRPRAPPEAQAEVDEGEDVARPEARVEVDEAEDAASPEVEEISDLAQILMKGNLKKYTYTNGWEEREFMVTPNGLYWESPTKGPRSVDGKYFNSIKKGAVGFRGNDETDFTLSTSYRGGMNYKFRSNASEIEGWLRAFQRVIDSKRGVVPEVRAEDVATEVQAGVSRPSQPSGKPGMPPWPPSVRASELTPAELQAAVGRESDLTREELRAAGLHDSIPEGEEHLWTVSRPWPKFPTHTKLDWDPMKEDWGQDLFSEDRTTRDHEEMELSEKMWSEGLTPHTTKIYLTDHLKKKSTGLWSSWDEIFLKVTEQGIYWVEGGVLNSILINNIEHCRLVESGDEDQILEIKTYKTQDKEEMPTYEFKLSETKSNSSLHRWLELLNYLIEMRKGSEKMDTLREDLLMGDAQKMAVAQGRLQGADDLAEQAAATAMLHAARDKASRDMNLSKKDLNRMVATEEAKRKRGRSPAVPGDPLMDQRRQFAPGSNEDLQIILAEMARREQLQGEDGGD